MTFINICKIYKQFKWVFCFYYHGPYVGAGGSFGPWCHSETYYFFFFCVCVCVCVCRVKPLDVGITKTKDPKVGAKGVFFCFWVISSLSALAQIKPWPLFPLPLTGMEKRKRKRKKFPSH